MKKLLGILAAMALLLGCFSLNLSAETPDSINITVNLTAKGQLQVAEKSTRVSDVDGDGKITVNDALTIAHDESFPGGAAAGYGAKNTDYGLSIVKLWGIEQGYSYGYYINDQAAWSLNDVLKEGDCLYAFAYKDAENATDRYSFFDRHALEVKAGDEITLTLKKYEYGPDYETLTLPVYRAKITLNGKETEYETDENGKVTLRLDEAGRVLIGAVDKEGILVPPVCIATVKGEQTPTVTPGKTPTGDHSEWGVLLAMVSASGALLCLKKQIHAKEN